MPTLADYPQITPFLWFDSNAEQVVALYTAIFPNSRVLSTIRSEVHNHVEQGSVLTIAFELNGQKFTALNGGPMFEFTEAVSFVIRCDTQAEIDQYWSALTANGGQPGRCCWLKDPFGLSWQVVPSNLPDLIRNPKAMQALMQMTRPDLAALEQAANS